MSDQELIAQSENPMTVDEVKNQVFRIQSVMKAVMIDGEHYGIIPGTKKKTLYKAGAEKLISTFRLVPDPEVEDLCMDGEIHYRVKVKMFSLSGVFIGAGIGECSSGEENYSWRKTVCKEEFDATAEDRKRVKWSKGYKGEAAYETNQVRMNPADIANTILKMAKKRALIDAVLTILAASDIFTQDIEDYPPEVRETVTEENGQAEVTPLKEPKRKSEVGKSDPKTGTKKEGHGKGPKDPEAPISEAQKKMLEALIGKSDIVGRDDVKMAFDVDYLADLTMGKMNEVMGYIKTGFVEGEGIELKQIDEFDAIQKKIGNDKFFTVLEGHGVEMVENIHSVEDAEKILEDLRLVKWT